MARPKKPKNEVLEKRVNLLVNEIDWNDFATLAHASESTPNQLINEYIRKVIKDNKELIEEHKKMKEKIVI